jgi:hypothetical protein
MFVAKNEELVPVAKTRALYAPRQPFSEWVTCGNEIRCEKRRNGPGGKNSCFVCTRHPFSEWVTCDNEITQNHPKHEFWT